MKKFLFITPLSFIAVLPIFSLSKHELYGTWANTKEQVEITSDTLYIDEIGNEGDGYTYQYNSQTNTITACDLFDKTTFQMVCNINDKQELIIIYIHPLSNVKTIHKYKKVIK